MKITYLQPQRRQPKIGDRRITKKHGLQIRVVETHHGMWVKSGSGYRYDWRKPVELLHTSWDYLLSPQERFACTHLRDMESAMLFGSVG